MEKEVIELQSTIRKYFSLFHWTREAFVEKFISEKFPDLDQLDPEYETEVRRALGRLKKHLETPIKKPAPLRTYIEFIKRQPEYSKVDSIIPQNHSEGFISKSFDEGMEKISRLISNRVKI